MREQVHSPYEEHAGGVRFFWGVRFTLLSLVWIYAVGIHQTQSLEPLRDNSSHFIARARRWPACSAALG